MTISQLDTDEQRAKFTQWLSDEETVIAVFENKNIELADKTMGDRIAMAFDISHDDDLVVGETRAPDTSSFIGWRYILVAKCYTAEDVIKAMKGEES